VKMPRLGILGDGQLGRMTALAAAELGVRVRGYSPSAEGPLQQVAAGHTAAPWDDLAALDAFADQVDVVTCEFENVPVAALQHLEGRLPVRPGAGVFRIAQDRLLEKQLAHRVGADTAPFAPVDGPADLPAALAQVGLPAILKTRRFGYDGKGQARIDHPDDAAAAWARLGGVPCLLEGFVPFDAEASVIVARRPGGEAACFPIVQNVHKNHILARTIAPGPFPAALADRARALALRLADELDLQGLLAVELFVGPGDHLRVNELAPRPHNSGHWTQLGCATSQFHQLVRAALDLPLGPVDLLHPTEMVNLIGDGVAAAVDLLAEPGAQLHLYGKDEARPGRKMGHVNRRCTR